jgi:uncharacterized membrane protein (UPF0127 family)
MVWRLIKNKIGLSVVILFAFSQIAIAQIANTPIQFEKQKIRVGKVELAVEIAKSEQQREHGLMFRKKENDGLQMLFIFETETRLAFWMKNTFVPLSIGYFNSEKILVDVQDMDPVHSVMENPKKTYQSREPAQYALEVPRGWFAKNKISLGQKFEFVEKH